MAAFSASLAAFLSALVDGFFFPAVVPVAAVESAARSSSLPLSSSAATGTTLTPPQAPPRRRLSSSAASDDGDDIGAELDCTRLIPIIREGSLPRLLGGAASGFGKERDKKSVLSKCLLVVVWPCGLRRGPPR